MNESNESIVFDRAVEYYDKTRALPAEVQAQVTEFLVAELQGRGLVLELGVGTGRMALPVHAGAVSLVGADLSEPMMAKLVENAGGTAPFPLVKADGLALPLPNDSVAAAYLCHVLHLIPRWEDVVGELVRVVAPGGVVLVDMGGQPTEVGREVMDAFSWFADMSTPRPGCNDVDALDRTFVALGARVRLAPPITFNVDFTIAAILNRYDGNQFSSTWSLTDEARSRAVAETRTWALERFGDLEATHSEEIAVQWRAYDLP